MNLQEAYSILELSQSASQDEAKKKYRELTKKYHPDINKEPGAEDKFKKINEAYGCVQSGKGTDREVPANPFGGGFNPFGGGFNPFARQTVYRTIPRNISAETTILFKDSVLGCKKDITFYRLTKCNECNGFGEQHINNGCDKCHGLGTITKKQGNMIFTQTCDKCGGVIQTKECIKCNASGSIGVDVSVQVQIPGGVVSGNILRLSGMGNYVGNMMGMDQYTDAHLTINVEPHKNLTLEGRDVVTSISISLLDALKGCTKQVETIHGLKDISIAPKSKNKDEIVMPNLGVEGSGAQKVILDISYPYNTEELIKTLSLIESNN